MKISINGKSVERHEATVDVLDHGLLYGDGIFEGLRVAAGRVFRLDTHLARLAVGASAIGLDLRFGVDGIRGIVRDTVARFAADEAYVRLVVTRGTGPLGVDPTTCEASNVICIVDRIALYRPEQRERGLSLVTSALRRPPPDVLDPRIKSLNYLNNALAKLEARRQGADETLLLNAAGHVAEAAVANVFCVRDGTLLTPPGSDGALEGVTRRTVLEMASELRIPAVERSLSRYDLLAAQEAFLTGTGAGLVPIRSLDAQPVGVEARPLFDQVNARYQSLLRAG